MAGQIWREARRVAQALSAEVNASERRFDLPTGGMLAIRSTHTPDYLRGAGLDYAVLDEAAYMPAETWAEVVRPMLMDRRGGALFISTPQGKNWFWDVYQLGVQGTPDWYSIQHPSHSNPRLSAEELASIERVTAPHIWQAEYLAQFVDDAGAVFRGVRSAAHAPVGVPYDASHMYSAGIDWGREHDYTAIVVLDVTTQSMVALDRFNQVGWHVQRERLNRLMQDWHPALIVAESNSIGAVNIEELARLGLPIQPFSMTSASKGTLIDSLALAIERGDLALLPDESLLGELNSYGLERLPSGIYRYSAPVGGHDDCVVALALAWRGAQGGRVRVGFV